MVGNFHEEVLFAFFARVDSRQNCEICVAYDKRITFQSGNTLNY